MSRYICSCSGGKDSVATVILAHEHNEPLDEIVFAEVMFAKNISGELPEHIDFIKNVAFPKFEEWGYKTAIVHSGETMLDWFFHRVQNSKTEGRSGKFMGWPLRFGCVMNSHGKVNAIRKYLKQQNQKVEQYVGIAIDEPVRLERANNKGQISLLEKYSYNRADGI